MARGTYNFPANFEVTIQELLDPRGGVEMLSDLINPDSFPRDGDTVYMKEGMVVTVRETMQLFMLKDLANIFAEDYSGWELVAGSNSGTGGALIIHTDLDFNTISAEQLTTGELANHGTSFEQIKLFVQKCGIIVLQQSDGKICYCTRAEIQNVIILGEVVLLHFVKDFSYTQYEIQLYCTPNNNITYLVTRANFKPDAELSFESEQPVQNKVVTDALGTKVDKEEGKGLSTEDFTTILKEKLESLANYDDSDLAVALESLQEQLNTLVSGNAKESIESFNEIIAFLDNIKDDTTLEGIIAAIQLEISGKQDAISAEDFASINGQSVYGGGEITVDKYDSEMDGDPAVVGDFGGIKSGTKLSQLKGKSYDELFDSIFFPVVYPELVGPSASISTSSLLRVVGEDAPKGSDFKLTFNRGAINLMGKKQNERAGAQNIEMSFIFVDADASNRTLPSVMKLGGTLYQYRAYYAEGPQPLDSRGDNYKSPLPAGYVDSAAVTVYGTYPYYATTKVEANNEPVRQDLIRWSAAAGSMTTPEFTLLPTATCPQIISTPREIKEIYIKDNSSGNFVLSNLNSFEKKTETRSGRTYYRYTYNGAARGEITLKIKF